MKAVYQKILTVYTDQGSVDEFFKGKNKALHLKIFKMLKDKTF